MATTNKKNQPMKLELKGTPNPVQQKFFLAREAHVGFGGARY